MRCSHGICRNNALDTMTVCINHLDKDALHILFNTMISVMENMKKEIKKLKETTNDLTYRIR